MLSSLSIRPLGARHSLLATPACSQGLWIGHFGSSSVRINPKKAVGLVEALHGKPPGAPYRVGWAHQQAGLPLEEQRRGQRVSRPLEAGTVLSRNSLPSSCTLWDGAGESWNSTQKGIIRQVVHWHLARSSLETQSLQLLAIRLQASFNYQRYWRGQSCG